MFFKNKSFRTKIMLFCGGAVVVSLLLSNIFSLISVRSLGNDGKQIIDESLRRANREYIDNYLETTRVRINQLLNQTKSELGTVAAVMQAMIDDPAAGEYLGEAVQRIPSYADRLKYTPLHRLPADKSNPKGLLSGDWVQNTKSSNSVIGIWSYLLDSDKKPKKYVSETVQKSKVFDLIGPALMKNGNAKLQVYYMGDHNAPVMRLTPYTDIAGTFDKLYNGHNFKPFWSYFFPGTTENWNKWKSKPSSQPFPKTDITVSYPYLDAATGSYIVTFFQPLWRRDRKSFAGAVAVDITLEQISNLIKDIKIADTGFAFLVLSDTNVLAMPEKREDILGLETVVAGNAGVSGIIRKLSISKYESIRSLELPKDEQIVVREIPIGNEGEKPNTFTVALAQLEGMNFWADNTIRAEYWSLGFIIPNSEIYTAISSSSSAITESTRNLLLLQVPVILGSLIILLGFIWPFTNSMTIGLTRLSEAAKRIENKDYNVLLEITSNDEIGTLTHSFNSMANEIQTYTSGLEDIVKERTKELEKANQAITALNSNLATENMRLGAEIDVARRLQLMVLPKTEELNAVENLDIAAFMQPADEIGGDYYDVLHEPGIVKIGIGDVTGHGLESGVLMIMVQTVVRTLLDSGQYNPVIFLSLLNQVIYKNVKRIDTEKNLSLSFIDYMSDKITLTGQHEEVIIIHEDGTHDRIDTIDLGFPVGLEPNIQEFVQSKEIYSVPGDTIVLFTDGITEAINENNEMYGIERFIIDLSANRFGTAEEMKKGVLKSLTEFIGAQRIFDDISLIIIKQKGEKNMILAGIYHESLESHPCLAKVTCHTDILQVKWSHCAAIADFFADYLVSGDTLNYSRRKADDLHHSFSYIMNELAENAVKFNVGKKISFSAGNASGSLFFQVLNGIAKSSIPGFSEKISVLSEGDPGELLIRKIEENAISNSGGSGIGFLTLMSDYGVGLGWKIMESQDSESSVNTMAIIDLKK